MVITISKRLERNPRPRTKVNPKKMNLLVIRLLPACSVNTASFHFHHFLLFAFFGVCTTTVLVGAEPSHASSKDVSTHAIDRSVLPMPNTVHPDLVVYDAKSPDAVFPAIPQVRPPEGSPNVLIVLLDDVGFGASSAFGGPCQMPTLDRLAASGLKYNRFHTTALCSPTRQALLTGRNHHSAGMAAITELATGAPGYSSVLPNSMAPLAMTMKLNGYCACQEKVSRSS